MAFLRLITAFAIVLAPFFAFTFSAGTTPGPVTAPPPPKPHWWMVIYDQPLFLGKSKNFSDPRRGVYIPAFPVKSMRWESGINDNFCETLCLDQLQIQFNCTSHVSANLTDTPANKILIWETTERLYCETAKNNPFTEVHLLSDAILDSPVTSFTEREAKPAANPV